MALEKITMPQLGESVTEGTISQWLVAPGDHVNKYDALAEVLTDKVTAEIPSSFTGTIKELIAAEDETLDVGAVICMIETGGGSESEKTPAEGVAPKSEPAVSTPKKAPAKQSTATGRFSPAVLTLAAEHGIDLGNVSGTGRGGRITRKDVLAYVENGAPAAPKPPVEESKTTQQQPSAPMPTSQVGDREIPIDGIRKAIAKHMVSSKHEIPHAWMMVEADATGLVRHRDALKNKFKAEEGYSLTYFAFFVKAVAQALKEYPVLNSTWAGDKIIERADINISIAVATDNHLFVPVIKHADEKSIKGIAREITELAAKARAGKLTQDDMSGGTFTVNSTGSFGSVQSMGIINHPQAAILQVESIVKRPVVIDDMIAIRNMVNLCLSIDHRILDGLVAGRFLSKVKENIETITKENTPIY
ncbi:dihydrolipoamide acetyltransferase family protein [Listeria cornellensis]|uniref:Dihydrolipoamide acetyltransferase component of pyruvate dehydrogenase complex n=1 Tax=Listeria cornellensis FSL F6-0969 TaxID=1265820 RepID=W7BVL6_9LIST|nr:dihydrolipoamide acetyltransferase family protein [Listeria cornellensis]EUJ30799.1 branched-chain alpha-keto acid dehydrogenase E2 subunit (lipoamide acyltransferase) [Listeria cornellensis FSL F6-0969]